MPWFMTPFGPQYVVEPGTVDEFERRDYTPLTTQQAADYFAGVAVPDPPSFATEAEVPGIVASAIAAGTGPVAEELRAAYVSVFTPEAYGATGDGTADDAAAVQAAITAAQAVRGVVLLGANKTYRITAPLVITGPMTLRGQGVHDAIGSFNENNGILEMPTVAPYLLGSVIRQDTPATDVIQINGQGITANLSDFGITFASPIAGKNTGHGIKVTPQSLGGQHDRGLWGAKWSNLKVHGCDGDHYSYWLLNPILSTFDHCYAYLGGGWYVACDSTSGNYGNLTFVDPYVCLGAGGTSDAYHFTGANFEYPGLLNLIAMIRPQGITGAYAAEFFGGTAATSGQRIFYGDNTVRWMSLVQPDFETGVGSGVAFPPQDFWIDPAGLVPELPDKSSSTVPRAALISAMQAPNSGAATFGAIASGSQWGGVSRYQSGAAAINDTFAYVAVLDGGTYRIDYYGTEGGDHGTVDLFMDGAYVGSMDRYSASLQLTPLPTTFTGVAVKGGGRHEIKVVVTGKNASSSGYYAAVSAISLTRTGA